MKLITEHDLPAEEDHEVFSNLQYQVDRWLGDQVLDGMAWMAPELGVDTELGEDVVELPSGTHIQLVYGFVKVSKRELAHLRREAKEAQEDAGV